MQEVIKEVPVVKEVERVVYVDRADGLTSRNENVVMQDVQSSATDMEVLRVGTSAQLLVTGGERLGLN